MLSDRGRRYSQALSKYIQEQQIEGLRVWTSWLKRTIQTVADVNAPQERWKALNEIDAVRSFSFSVLKILNNHDFFTNRASARK